jgi:drug/metabolite transporter (DMT)-like permease
MMTAILVATAGVLVMSIPRAAGPGKPGKQGPVLTGGLRPTLLGLASGAMLALAVICFRGAILSLGLANFVMAATFTLVVGLAIQSVTFSLYLWLRQPGVMLALLRSWKRSLFAGFMGALASQFWFLAFALATAASVRTLALVEVLFAQLVARFMFGQKTTVREAFGMVLVVAGVVLLILAY